MPWNPKRYHQFQSERSEPFEDLLKLVTVRPGMKVVDLGCGTGDLTVRLAELLPESDVLGLDTSPEMLEQAKGLSRDGLRFELGDQASLSDNWDLIFSNAALQWSPDHWKLIPHLFQRLNTGGQLVVQVPSNHNSVVHRAINELAGQEPFRKILDGWTRQSPVLGIEEYARLLFEQNASAITVFEKVYPHVLDNANAIIDWVSGTALIPYFERLGEHKEEFVEALRSRLHAIWPTGPVFYPFKRTLMCGEQSG
jgi:trans-aconitate 2-methyltransferase